MIILYALLAIILILLFIGLLVAFAITLLFLFPMANGAVYVPSKDLAIETMIKLGRVTKGKKVVDLGSGDGRVVAALAKTGAEADGYEVNPWLVFKAKQLLRQAGLQDRTQIFMKSYWDVNLAQYDVVTLYGITYIMKGLEKKLQKELRPGAVVLSNYFQFPNWKPVKQANGVYKYTKKVS